jgi:antirestriction protein ArdC
VKVLAVPRCQQALSFGANVRKGEHGTTIVHADRFVPKNEK